MTLQMARELTRRHGVSVIGLSPRKMSGTGMSKDIASEVSRVRGWTPEETEKNQLSVSLTGKELEPAIVAETVAFLLGSRDRFESFTGCVIPF